MIDLALLTAIFIAFACVAMAYQITRPGVELRKRKAWFGATAIIAFVSFRCADMLVTSGELTAHGARLGLYLIFFGVVGGLLTGLLPRIAPWVNRRFAPDPVQLGPSTERPGIVLAQNCANPIGSNVDERA